MSSGPCITMVLERENAIAHLRETMGATNPHDAANGTIRKDFAESIERNAIHGSDAPETAAFEITACEPPSHLALTWEFGGEVSWVEVHLADDGTGRTRLTLTHTAHLTDHYAQYGPGATGVGWELGVVALALHLAGQPMLDEEAFGASPEGKRFMTASSEGWGQASIASGTDAEAARAAATRTTAFYTGESSEPA